MVSLKVEIYLPAARANMNPYKEVEHSKYILEDLFKQTIKKEIRRGGVILPLPK